MKEELVTQVKKTYADPNLAVSRYGAKAHMDLVIVELAILDELQHIREALQKSGDRRNGDTGPAKRR